MIEKIKDISVEIFDEIVRLRQHLHKNPELSFEEFHTSKFIQNFLTLHKIPFKTGIVKTGIVAKIEGKNPNQKEIVLRADIDALPIKEENKTAYCLSLIHI